MRTVLALPRRWRQPAPRPFARAAAGPPAVDARAWLVENPATGEVLAAHDARYQTPIASITKLMTVIVALEHLKLADVVHVDPRAAAVGQESIYLEPASRSPSRDLVKGGADPVGERRRRRARARDRARASPRSPS